MSEDEGFLRRWARRKAEAVEAEDKPAAAPTSAPAPTAPAALPEVDLATLPSLESITAETDIRGFLAPGVPAELSRAALRRAWAADPQIRDFIEIAENQWDFTATDELHGFGQLGVEEARKLVAEILGEGNGAPPAPSVAALPENAALPSSPAAAAVTPDPARDASGRNQQASLEFDSENDSQVMAPAGPIESDSQPADGAVELADSPPRRSHGRALPA